MENVPSHIFSLSLLYQSPSEIFSKDTRCWKWSSLPFSRKSPLSRRVKANKSICSTPQNGLIAKARRVQKFVKKEKSNQARERLKLMDTSSMKTKIKCYLRTHGRATSVIVSRKLPDDADLRMGDARQVETARAGDGRRRCRQRRSVGRNKAAVWQFSAASGAVELQISSYHDVHFFGRCPQGVLGFFEGNSSQTFPVDVDYLVTDPEPSIP